MKKHDKIYLLDQILKSAKFPVSRQYLEERLESSTATIYRLINDLRDGYGAPIVTDNESGKFYYAEKDTFELPGMRLKSDEIQALLLATHLLEDVQEGLLKEPLSRLLDGISSLLKDHGIVDQKKIQIIHALSRKADTKIFSSVFSALQNENKIEIEYLARSTKEKNSRIISPLNLTNYKNSWYLDSWCHLRNGIRSFALEQIESLTELNEPIKKITEKELSSHFSGSYGIFSGSPDKVARLKILPEVAQWVIKENWHSKQKINHLNDGSLFLEIPYHNDIELIMDILRYGKNIIVLSPDELKDKVQKTLSDSLKNYQ